MWHLVLQLVFLQLANAPLGVAAGEHPDIQHWELDSDLASAVGGDALVVEGAPAKLVEVTLPDGAARALEVPPEARVRVPTDLVPDRPGFVDDFTLVMDLKVDAAPWVRAPLVQTDGDDDDDAEAELVLQKGGKKAVFGVGGTRGGTVSPGEWHRLALVVDGQAGLITYYVDGEKAASAKKTIADSRWSLEPELLLFSDDEDQKGQPTVWLAALQVRGAALSAGDMRSLGGPAAAGIPKVAPGTFVFRVDGATVAPGELVTAHWDAALPTGEVTLALVNDSAAIVLGKVPMASASASFRVPIDAQGAWTLATRGLPGGDVQGPRYTVVGTPFTAPLGQDLVTNGSFTSGLDGWTVSGAVAPGKGASDQGIQGGAGDFTVSQAIALPPRAAELGLVVDAKAMLTRKEGKGRFDDRGELFVRFRDAAGHDLGRLRSLATDMNSWSPYTLRGIVPPGATVAELGVQAWMRRGVKNEVAADDLSLVLESDARPSTMRLSKRPIVSPADAPNHLTLLFETDLASAWPTVTWGADGAEQHTVGPTTRTTIAPRHAVHEVDIGPLEPGKAYRYSVNVGPYQSPSWVVHGPADPASRAPQKIVWLADNQHGWQTFRDMLPKIAEAKPDLALLAGDIVQHGFMLREWQTEWFATLSVEDFGQTTPVYFARGNHDGEHALSYAYTHLPGNAAWFAFTTAGARIIVLDTEADQSAAPEQKDWLVHELESPASKAADFRIVTFHKAPFSNRWSSAKSTYDGEDWVRQWWVPVFEDHHVDLVIAGHAHAYGRMDKAGVRYLVVGGAGGALDTYKTAKWPMEKDIPVHHWALMEVGEGKLHWTVRDDKGAVIDTMTMHAKKHTN